MLLTEDELRTMLQITKIQVGEGWGWGGGGGGGVGAGEGDAAGLPAPRLCRVVPVSNACTPWPCPTK